MTVEPLIPYASPGAAVARHRADHGEAPAANSGAPKHVTPPLRRRGWQRCPSRRRQPRPAEARAVTSGQGAASPVRPGAARPRPRGRSLAWLDLIWRRQADVGHHAPLGGQSTLTKRAGRFAEPGDDRQRRRDSRTDRSRLFLAFYPSAGPASGPQNTWTGAADLLGRDAAGPPLVSPETRPHGVGRASVRGTTTGRNRTRRQEHAVDRAHSAETDASSTSSHRHRFGPAGNTAPDRRPVQRVLSLPLSMRRSTPERSEPRGHLTVRRPRRRRSRREGTSIRLPGAPRGPSQPDPPQRWSRPRPAAPLPHHQRRRDHCRRQKGFT